MEEEKNKNKQNQIKSKHEFFLTSANNIVKSKKLEKRLFFNKFTFDVGDTHKSKNVYIKLKPTSQKFHSNVVKLSIDCTNKMMSSITMKSESNIRKKVSEGKKSYAALRLLDEKVS